jgi:hypothetical protein
MEEKSAVVVKLFFPIFYFSSQISCPAKFFLVAPVIPRIFLGRNSME